MRDGLLVAVGAVPGAWLRFRLVNHLEPMLPRKHWATFGVNMAACFALGLLTALERGCAGSRGLALLLAVGFLGSFSTFSTFSVEMLTAWLSGARRQALLLLLASVLGGLLALVAGLALVAL
jgi:CrcB protein